MRNLYILVSPRRIQVDSALHRTAVEGRNVHAVHVFLQNVFLQNAHADDTIMMSVMVVLMLVIIIAITAKILETLFFLLRDLE